MNRKNETIIGVIAAIALCLSLASLLVSLNGSGSKKQDVQYVMYVGTNDKDTNAPIFPPEESKVHAEDILIRHFGGYTIQEANGGWESDGTRYSEYTLVIYLSDTTIDKVHAAADDMIKEFNQSSVLIQTNSSITEFYSGK